MLRAARAVSAALDEGCRAAKPGARTLDIDAAVRHALKSAGAYPAMRFDPATAGFPGACCVCVNEEVTHAPPGPRLLRERDLVTVDVAAAVGESSANRAAADDRWFADAARAIVVGGASGEGRGARLVRAAEGVLAAMLGAARPGTMWSSVARAAERAARESGVRLVPGFAGHGIGRGLHLPPATAAAPIPDASADFTLEPGMTLTFEPIVTEGDGLTVTLDDGWTVVTRDRAWAVHVERTVAVGEVDIRIVCG